MSEERSFRRPRQLAMATALLLASVGPHAQAHDCPGLVPEHAPAHGALRLCRSAHAGAEDDYACQDYVVGASHYRLLFKGGRSPKALLRLAPARESPETVWRQELEPVQRVCDLPPPAGVPAAAAFLGAGVCRDERERPVACGVFRHAAARDPRIYDYMVFYDTSGAGPRQITAHAVGRNPHALVAELAYQIGESLYAHGCCRDRALAYLAYAYGLFPDAADYRLAYDNAARPQLARP